MILHQLIPTSAAAPADWRALIDKALFIAALLVIAATTFAAHPGATGDTIPAFSIGGR